VYPEGAGPVYEGNDVSRRLALITGASAGIGAGFATRYAEEGYDLLLVARRKARLEILAKEISDRTGVRVDVLPADLSDRNTPTEILKLVSRLRRPVHVLVNNAGSFEPHVFSERPWSRHASYLQLMLASHCELTRELLPGMLQAGTGRIINVASLQGLIPGVPDHAMYSAAKSFLIKFSQALNLELRGTGVHVTALCPGLTTSDFFSENGTLDQFKSAAPSWAWQDTGAVVEAGVRAVELNRAVEVPGLPNRLISEIARCLPPAWSLWLTGKLAVRFGVRGSGGS
jgi:short-subunit dehydrogenase